ncbi:MAG: HD domain-containing protein [Bacteroidota bacterium]
MSTLERAIVIATEAHAGERDKGGAHYILHPLRVMLSMTTEAEQIAAVLHDVVEDSEWTLDALRGEGFSEEVVRAIDHLTRRDGETYAAFVQRAGEDPVAARVKAADLIDNMDLSRIANPTARDHERIAKYKRALATLRSGPYVS